MKIIKYFVTLMHIVLMATLAMIAFQLRMRIRCSMGSVPPQTVKIMDKFKTPFAGQNQTIELEVAGSSPWCKDNNE